MTTGLVPDPQVEPTMQVEQVAKAFHISRASAYEGVKTGEIPSIKIGKRPQTPPLRRPAVRMDRRRHPLASQRTILGRRSRSPRRRRLLLPPRPVAQPRHLRRSLVGEGRDCLNRVTHY